MWKLDAAFISDYRSYKNLYLQMWQRAVSQSAILLHRLTVLRCQKIFYVTKRKSLKQVIAFAIPGGTKQYKTQFLVPRGAQMEKVSDVSTFTIPHGPKYLLLSPSAGTAPKQYYFYHSLRFVASVLPPSQSCFCSHKSTDIHYTSMFTHSIVSRGVWYFARLYWMTNSRGGCFPKYEQ